MPIYVYECADCLGTWKENHGMSETIEECNWCDSKNIYRKPPPVVSVFKPHTKKKKVGDITKEYIENAREELKQQKNDMDKDR